MKTGKININTVLQSNFRIDPSLHLSEGVKCRAILHKSPYGLKTVEECSSRIFLGNIFSRCFVKSKEYGVTYLSASDTVLADIETGRYISKKQAKQLSYLMLEKDWILATCSGTLGNITYTNKHFCDKIATHDLIRVIPLDLVMKKGCLYAFLSSRYGYYQITQSQFGGVVKHINDKQLGNVIIPSFPHVFQKEVDNLIQESIKLREEAVNSLKEAHSIIEKRFEVVCDKKASRVSIQSILSSHNKRFEAFYHTSVNRALYDYIIGNFEYKTLGEVTSRIFRPGIFKREYVSNGVTFLGGADILMAIPSSDKKLSFRQVEKMPELKVKKDWILVTCGGTIGNTVLIDGQLEKCVISQHVMRVVPKDDILKGYLYAVLSSSIGKELITMFTTGSVIPQIEAHHLELVPIPLLEREEMVKIDSLVSSYVSKIEISKEKELKAIRMVEEEIEKWNN